MNDHTLTVLEFDRLLELICQQAQSEPGMEIIRSLRPRRELAEIQARRGLYDDMLAVRECEVEQPGLRIEDLSSILREAAPEGAVLAGQDLLVIRSFLDTVAQAAAFVQHRECENFTHLRRLAAPLEVCADLRTALQRSLDVDGAILDSASERLRDLRRQISQMEQRIQRRLDQIIRSNENDSALQEKFVTVRNGRYVVPVRRDDRNALPGLVHDLSNSGQTLFVEPTETLAWGNDLARLRLEERDEIRRILAALSAQVRRYLEALRTDQRICRDGCSRCRRPLGHSQQLRPAWIRRRALPETSPPPTAPGSVSPGRRGPHRRPLRPGIAPTRPHSGHHRLQHRRQNRRLEDNRPALPGSAKRPASAGCR